MYKILIKTCSASNNIWNFYQEDGVDYVAASLEDMKPTTLTLLKKYGKKNIKIIDQMSGQDMDNADVYIYDSTDNYEELSNRPYINGTEIVGQLTLEDLGIQPAGEYATEAYVQEMMSNIEMPDVDLTGYATEEYVDNAIKEIDDNTIVVRLEKTTSSQTDAQKAIIQEVLPLLTSKNIIIQLYEKPATTQSYVDMIYRTFYWRPLLIEDISAYTGSLYWYGEASPSIHILNDMAYNSKTQPYIIIKVENGIVTNIDGLGGGSAQYQASTEIDLLTKRYNKSWTPTQDYNPVHKKYVDDAIASIDIPETDLTDYATTQYVDSAMPKIYRIEKENAAALQDAETVSIVNQWYQDYLLNKNSTIIINTKVRQNGWNEQDFSLFAVTGKTLHFISTGASKGSNLPNFYVAKGTMTVTDGQVTAFNCGNYNSYISVDMLPNYDVLVTSSNVLTRTNTSSYTPTEDYNPATKKYVDDAVASIDVSGGESSGGLEKVYELTMSSINYNDIAIQRATTAEVQKLSELITQCYKDGIYRPTIIVYDKYDKAAFLKPNSAINDMGNIGWYLYGTYTTFSTPADLKGLQEIYSIACSVGGALVNGVYTATKAEFTSVKKKYLPLDNTIEYTPTSDYHPTTKKYVDDAIASVSGGSGGGADLTNYYTKAEVDALLQELRNEFVSANNNINDKLETIIYGGE